MSRRDPIATQRRILEAARKEFAAKGISGARVDAIAVRANTHKRMLYYYFHSKEELFREVLRHRLGRKLADPVSGRVSYAEWLGFRVALPPQWREYVRLQMWEALEMRGRNSEILAEEERREAYDQLRERLAIAQGAGEIPADIDLDQMLLSEMALIMFPVAFPQIVRLTTGYRPDSPEFLAKREEHLRQLGEHLASQSQASDRLT